mmetsp:Transcript_83395/g.174502  ORF Transcript_83395/g.174502 Transcript_83395/m.174502 type:complete len:224 (-) Transcript_83395:768-1439(-)
MQPWSHFVGPGEFQEHRRRRRLPGFTGVKSPKIGREWAGCRYEVRIVWDGVASPGSDSRESRRITSDAFRLRGWKSEASRINVTASFVGAGSSNASEPVVSRTSQLIAICSGLDKRRGLSISWLKWRKSHFIQRRDHEASCAGSLRGLLHGRPSVGTPALSKTNQQSLSDAEPWGPSAIQVWWLSEASGLHHGSPGLGLPRFWKPSRGDRCKTRRISCFLQDI